MTTHGSDHSPDLDPDEAETELDDTDVVSDDADVVSDAVDDEDDDTDVVSDAEDEENDDESVLLTETAPGSVLTPEEEEAEEDEADEVEADEAEEEQDEAEAVEADEAEAAASPEALLEPVGSDTPVDPGTGRYEERWSAIQAGFIDDPRRSVESASSLLAEMWAAIEQEIADERQGIDSGWQQAERSTDDLRVAMLDYRSLYNRLVAFTSW